MIINNMNIIKLDKDFYIRETLDVSKELLGKYLIHIYEGKTLISRITETEAYKEDDKGAHFNGGKKTERTKVAFESGGVAYVYLIYGMYYCFNVVTGKEETPGAVLIRKVEPIYGIEYMLENRKIDLSKIKNCSDGPGKLCIAMNITKKENGINLTGDKLFIGKNIKEKDITNFKTGKRINIDYAEECKDYLWRFYI